MPLLPTRLRGQDDIRGDQPDRRRRTGLKVAVATVAALGVAVGAVTISAANDSTARVPSSTTTTVPGATSTAGGATSVAVPGPTSTSGAVTSNGAPAVSVPGGAVPGRGAFDAVSCPQVSACVAVGGNGMGTGVIATSRSEGAAWTLQPQPLATPDLLGVDCPSVATCVAVGPNAAMTMDPGGAAWSLHSLPTRDTTLLGVSCPTTTHCVAGGIAPVSGGSVGGRMLVSVDGGATWTTSSLPVGTGGIAAVTCTSATSCIAVGAGIFRSDDGGATWRFAPVDGGITGSLTSVACSTPLHCEAVGPNPVAATVPTAAGVAVVTDDGGATWRPLSLPATSGSARVIRCWLGTNCLVAGSSLTFGGPGLVESSSDGGATWHADVAPPRMSDIADVSCPSTTDCVMVGDAGQPGANSDTAISAATSDGTTWQTHAEPDL